MSRASQRKENVIANGFHDALKGHHVDSNPYIHPRGRALWLEGYNKGLVEKRKRARVQRRKDRLNPDESWPLTSLWRLWYAFKDLFSGRVGSAAQNPARRRGFGL